MPKHEHGTDNEAPSHVPKPIVEKANNDQNDHSLYDRPSQHAEGLSRITPVFRITYLQLRQMVLDNMHCGSFRCGTSGLRCSRLRDRG